MTKAESQALVLDRLMEALERGNREKINLLEELSGEIKFIDLRAAVCYLAALSYIEYDDHIPQNQGFYCKITKEGIKYHHAIFEHQDTSKKEKTSFVKKLKEISEFFESAKAIAVTVFMIMTMVLGFNAKRIAQELPMVANLLGISEIQEQKENKEAPIDSKTIQVNPDKVRNLIDSQVKKSLSRERR